MRTDFDSSSTESDVEQFFITPFLTDPLWLGIPEIAILTKHNLAVVELDKGKNKRRYAPDYVVYSDSIPVLVVEAKSPQEDAQAGFREAQLYAHELNKQYPKTLDPARYILACNGKEIVFGFWNTNDARVLPMAQLKLGVQLASRLKDEFEWSALQKFAIEIATRLFPQGLSHAYEFLGENRVRLAKVGTNAFSEQLDPLLKRFFQSQRPEYEDEIIRRAYVTSDDTTKYERLFETYLRERVIHLHDPRGKILEPKKYQEPTLTEALGASAAHKMPQGKYS